MPESPEVDALAEYLRARVTGRTVAAVDVAIPRAVKAGDAASLSGCRVAGVRRHGKLIALALHGASGASGASASSGAPAGEGDRFLVVHWGHDGWLVWHDSVPDARAHSEEAALILRLRLDDGSGFDLVDAGRWVGASVFVVDSVTDVPAIAALGPDPLDPEFDRADLVAALGGRRKQLKALLQEQRSLAGIGNAYSDEVLHAARLSPVAHAAALSEDDIDRLGAALHDVLTAAVRQRAGTPPDALKDDKRAGMRVHRRPGEQCPVCGDSIAEITFSGAAAHYCPTCQTGGRALA